MEMRFEAFVGSGHMVGAGDDNSRDAGLSCGLEDVSSSHYVGS